MKRMMMIWAGLAIAVAGCATSPIPEIDTKECTTRVSQALSQRDLEVANARAEVALGKIAAAKQAAELQELHSLVSQLRQENGASQQAIIRLEREIATNQEETERIRHAHEQAEQSKQAQHLTDLKHTVAALTQELDHLKQDIQLTITDAVNKRKDLPASGTAKGKGTVQKQSQASGGIPQKRSSGQVDPIGFSLGRNGIPSDGHSGMVQTR